MRPNTDPSDRERALREADAQLDALRRTRKRRRDPDEESLVMDILGGIIIPIARAKFHALLLFVLMAIMFVSSWCATP